MKLTKTDVIVAICLALCIPFCNMCIMLLGINGENPALWYTFPGFFVALLYTIGKGRTLRDLLDVVVSGLVGILWAYLGAELIGILIPVMGAIPGVFVSVAVMVFIFGALMGPLPTFFNNYGFMYYLVMALFVTQMLATWAVCELVVGAVVMMIIGITVIVMQAINSTTFFSDSNFKDMALKSLMFVGCGTFLLTGSQVVNRFIG